MTKMTGMTEMQWFELTIGVGVVFLLGWVLKLFLGKKAYDYWKATKRRMRRLRRHISSLYSASRTRATTGTTTPDPNDPDLLPMTEEEKKYSIGKMPTWAIVMLVITLILITLQLLSIGNKSKSKTPPTGRFTVTNGEVHTIKKRAGQQIQCTTSKSCEMSTDSIHWVHDGPGVYIQYSDTTEKIYYRAYPNTESTINYTVK